MTDDGGFTGDAFPNWYDDPSFWFHRDELPPRPRRARQDVFGSGRLATAAELRRFSSAEAHDRHALRLRNVGLLAEPLRGGRHPEPLAPSDLYLPRELREKHVLAVGLTGVGKTQKLILPQLAEDIRSPGRAMIALDAKGGVIREFMTHLAARFRPGEEVHQVNLKRPTRNTIGWNPVRSVRSRQDALEIAHAVCTNVESGVPPKDPFWMNSSIALLADILRMLGTLHPATASLARAKELVDAFPHDLAVAIDGHEDEYPAVRRVLENANQNPATSIIADLAMRLLVFDDEGIAECVCGENELDVESLVRDGGMLVLEVNEPDASELTPLTNLFVTRMFTALMELADKQPDRRLPRPTSITLDELGSACGRIHDFEKRLATLRSRGVSLIGAVQTLSQLHDLYGFSGTAIVGNFNTKLFFGGGLGAPDARYASDLSGTMTAEYVSVTRQHDGPRKSVSTTTSPVARPVLLPEEIARPPEHPLFGPPVTVFTPALPPFFAYLSAAHQLPGVREALPSSPVFDPDLGTPVASLPDRRSEATIPLDATKSALDWMSLAGAELKWWEDLERRFRSDTDAFARLLRRLADYASLYHQATGRSDGLLQEFYKSSLQSGVVSFEANLSYLHWKLTQRHEEAYRQRGEG